MPTHWPNQIPVAITVTDADGIITEMNDASAAVFAAEGGLKLIGTNVLDCHPEPSRTQLFNMYKDRRPNHYTITKNGRRKMIHQLPLFDGDVFRGYIEISIPIPDHLPHFNRDKP
jgi:transcriptional regulator with PAS, ATPase and Fis domain